MTNQYTTAVLRSLLDILGGQSEYRGAVLDFLDYVDRTVPQDEPRAGHCPICDQKVCDEAMLEHLQERHPDE